jgi:hypothetical protein
MNCSSHNGDDVECYIHSSDSLHSFISDSTAILLGPGLFFSFVIISTQTVGLLGRGISPSQGRYLDTEQHRINAHTHPCLEWDSSP